MKKQKEYFTLPRAFCVSWWHALPAVSSFCPTKTSADDIKWFLITCHWNVVRIKVADNCDVYRNYLIVEPLLLIYFFVVSRSFFFWGGEGRKEEKEMLLGGVVNAVTDQKDS